jgi:HD-GYP domain-containing protein (c-di-GMP phosphodiesterase class II)/DNA-binding CsgD family transcriptional regulator
LRPPWRADTNTTPQHAAASPRDQHEAASAPRPLVGSGVRRAELLAALSLAVDVGLGQPMEHMLRSCHIAVRLAEAIGLDRDRQTIVYYVDLTAWIGCHADSRELAMIFGDDIAFRADSYAVDWRGWRWKSSVLNHVGRGSPALKRARDMGAFVLGGRSAVSEVIRSHCLSASMLAERLGLGPDVCDILPHAFERWDGGGLPAALRGEDLALEMRIVQLADIVEVHHRLGGLDQAVAVARRRSGAKFDPAVVDAFCRHASELLAGLDNEDVWQSVVAPQVGEGHALTEPELDSALEAMADFVDLKLSHTGGHSRGVACLVSDAASGAGLNAADVRELRRAALVHDLGHLGVSNLIWDKPGPHSPAERERVRLHPYLTERMLSRPPALHRIGELAGRHHERLDGSGYPHGLPATALSPAARLLAAADVYHALLEVRPHRPGRSPQEAAGVIRDEVRAGHLDGDAVDGVLGAAGHRIGRRRSWPAELTSREVEVLGLVAQGGANRDIARQLSITEKTLRNHLEHIYSKVGVGNRTGAVLFAIEHGLAGPFPHA